MKTPGRFCSVEQHANATVGSRKANDYSGLSTAFGTAFNAQPGKLKSGSQFEVKILTFDGHAKFQLYIQ